MDLDLRNLQLVQIALNIAAENVESLPIGAEHLAKM